MSKCSFVEYFDVVIAVCDLWYNKMELYSKEARLVSTLIFLENKYK
jgi:hypothetical protein